MSDFEHDLQVAVGEAIHEDEVCRAVWSALANVVWYHPASGAQASYSFRAAGALIAELRGAGNYLDWYCGSPAATVTDQLRRAMKKRGWLADTTPDICEEPGCLEDASCAYRGRLTCTTHQAWFAAPPTD